EFDFVRCTYLKPPNGEAMEVDRSTVDFPVGSHHVHIYRSDTPEPDGVKECTAGIDWNRWSLVVGVQTKPLDWQLPAGVTVPLKPHEQLLVQVHWLNLTGSALDRTIPLQRHKSTHSDTPRGGALG